MDKYSAEVTHYTREQTAQLTAAEYEQLQREVRKALRAEAARYWSSSHADGKPCRNSYGWCFAHMAKALPR